MRLCDLWRRLTIYNGIANSCLKYNNYITIKPEQRATCKRAPPMIDFKMEEKTAHTGRTAHNFYEVILCK